MQRYSLTDPATSQVPLPHCALPQKHKGFEFSRTANASTVLVVHSTSVLQNLRFATMLYTASISCLSKHRASEAPQCGSNRFAAGTAGGSHFCGHTHHLAFCGYYNPATSSATQCPYPHQVLLLVAPKPLILQAAATCQ